MTRQSEKAERFRALHVGEPFVIPNPWDAGSARVLEALGFQALATTSSGFAFTLGRRDGGVTLDEMAAHVHALDLATGLPISADLENGYGADPQRAARAIAGVAEAEPSAPRSRTTTRRRSDLRDRARRRADRRGVSGRASAPVPVHAHRASGEPHPR